MNDLLQWLLRLDPVWVYCCIFFFAYVENLFPPSPSDTLIVFAGALAAMEKGNFLLSVLSATGGSILGFMTMYMIGRWFGRAVIEKGKLAFISLDSVHRMESWFSRYGYWLIVANRFLTGTRAVISFFAGMSNLDFAATTALSALSALAWNSILVYAGYSLGAHWEDIGGYLHTYSKIISAIVILFTAGVLVRFFYLRRKRNG